VCVLFFLFFCCCLVGYMMVPKLSIELLSFVGGDEITSVFFVSFNPSYHY